MMTFTTTPTINKQALTELYEAQSPGLFRYAFRLLGDQDMAEECVSETFSRFLHVVKNGKGPDENPRAYLYRTVHNWVIDHYRKQPLPPLSLAEDMASGESDDVSQKVAREMLRDHVRSALLRLPAEQQQVIQLRFLEDWSHEAVADQLGKSVEATRAIQHRAIDALRRMLIEKKGEYDER